MAFSATHSAFEGFRLAKRSPLTIIIWAVFLVVMIGALLALAGGSMLGFMEAAQQLESGAEPTPEQMSAFMMSYLSFIGPISLGGILFGSVIYAAANRAVVRPSESAFGYLRLGMDEVRIILTQIVLSFVLVLAFGLIGGILGGGVAALGFSMGEQGMAVTILAAVVAYIVFFALVIWIAVRLSLVYAITVAERRFAIFDSWSLTKGRFWSLLGMNILAAIMLWVVQFVVSIIVLPIVFFGLNSVGGPEGFEAMEWSEAIPALAPYAIGLGIIGALFYAFAIAVTYTPAASAYLGLMEERNPAPPIAPTAPPSIAPVTPAPAAPPPVTPPSV